MAKQNEKLRKDHYIGTVDMVVNFFTWLMPGDFSQLASDSGRKLITVPILSFSSTGTFPVPRCFHRAGIQPLGFGLVWN